MLSRIAASDTWVRVQSWERPGVAPPEALGRQLGVEWPLEVGQTAVGRSSQVGDSGRGRPEVICLGPTDWLVLAAAEEDVGALSGVADSGGFVEALQSSLRGSAFRATDLSSALARIRVDGPHAQELIAKGCAVHGWRPGSAARTLIAGVPVVVRCLGATVFECVVALSFADYLLRWLKDAALEFGGEA